MRERVSVVITAVVLCVMALAAQAPAPAPPAAGAPQAAPPQGPPPKPKNLTILPKDIDHDQLIAIMRGFSGALGVPCTHCHVETEPHKMDFASDDKDEKKTAREMLKMTEAINADYVKKISGNDPDATVMCITCHRGQKHPPQPLDAILSEAVAKNGVESAIAKYKQLRSESLEAGFYDFRDMTLLSVARRLRDEKKTDQSLALIKSTVDLFPNSANVAAALGMALFESGDRAGAKTQFDRALQIDPANGAAQMGLKRLEAPPR